MKIVRIIFATLSIVFFTGCIGSEYTFNNVDIPTENKELSFKIIPINPSSIAGYSAFILNIQNKTDRDMEIDWNKTNFIKDGSTSGTFMFEGIVYKDRNTVKANDVIFANSTFTKTIYPNNYVKFDSYGWYHVGTGLGSQGAYVVIIDGQKTIKQKVIVNINEKN